MTKTEAQVAVRAPQPPPIPISRHLLFGAIAGMGCFLDLLTKRLVFQWRGMPEESPIWWLWQGKIGIETTLNTGALFGLGQEKVLFFAMFSIVALVGVLIWYVWAGVGRDLVLTLILACVTGGILGNLYDRLGLWEPTYRQQPAAADGMADVRPARTYAVRDWIRLSYGKYVWPNFNIADCLLVVGATWLVWHSFRDPRVSETSDGSRAKTLARGS